MEDSEILITLMQYKAELGNTKIKTLGTFTLYTVDCVNAEIRNFIFVRNMQLPSTSNTDYRI